MTPGDARGDRTARVQSVERAFELLEHLAAADSEMGLTELSVRSGLPVPTIHRLLRALVEGEYVRHLPSRRYALGARLIRLGESASSQLGSWARPHLAELVAETQETANMAILEGDEVVYVAQVPSKHSMRMFTEVGRRALPHCTAVGKALLAQLPTEEATAIIARTGLPAYTPHTITDVTTLITELGRIRQEGWAVDDSEQELGVHCLAAPLIGAPTTAAVSVSGPTARITVEVRRRIVPVLRRVAGELATALSYGNSTSSRPR